MTSSNDNLQCIESNCQGIVSLNKSLIKKVKRKVKFSDDLAVFPSSCFSGRLNEDSLEENVSVFMNFPHPWENVRASRYYTLKLDDSEHADKVRRRSFSSDDVPSDTESLHSVQSCLDGITLRCQSADGVRPSKRSSRRIICKYIEKTPKADDKNRKKSPRGTVVSQAVFPDENNPSVATPVLRLKKGKRCDECQRYTTLCPCKLEELRKFSEKWNPPVAVRHETATKIPSSQNRQDFHNDPGKPPSSRQTASTKKVTSAQVFLQKPNRPPPPRRQHFTRSTSTKTHDAKIHFAKQDQTKRVTFMAPPEQPVQESSRNKPPVPMRRFVYDAKTQSSQSRGKILKSNQSTFQTTSSTNVPFEHVVPIQNQSKIKQQKQSNQTNMQHPPSPNRPNYPHGVRMFPFNETQMTENRSPDFVKTKPLPDPNRSKPHTLDAHQTEATRAHIQPTTRSILIQQDKPPRQSALQKNPPGAHPESSRSYAKRIPQRTSTKIPHPPQEVIVTEPRIVRFEDKALSKPKSYQLKSHTPGNTPTSSFSSTVVLSLRSPEKSKERQKSRALFSPVEPHPWRKWQSRNTNFSNNCSEKENRREDAKDLFSDSMNRSNSHFDDNFDMLISPACSINLIRNATSISTESNPICCHCHPANRHFKGLLLYETTSSRRKVCPKADARNKGEMASEVDEGVITTPQQPESNVEEEPMLKVKDIRNKYKVRDYENYAKPKSATGGKAAQNADKNLSSKDKRLELIEDDLTGPDHEVAQQVMSLFEGALNVEKQLEALELEEQLEQNEETQRAADLNSPSKTNGHDISISVEQTSETEDTADDTPPTPNNSASTPIPEVTADEKGSEHTTQADGKPAASFDESLDQFYDVLSGLTTS